MPFPSSFAVCPFTLAAMTVNIVVMRRNNFGKLLFEKIKTSIIWNSMQRIQVNFIRRTNTKKFWLDDGVRFFVFSKQIAWKFISPLQLLLFQIILFIDLSNTLLFGCCFPSFRLAHRIILIQMFFFFFSFAFFSQRNSNSFFHVIHAQTFLLFAYSVWAKCSLCYDEHNNANEQKKPYRNRCCAGAR